MGAKITLNEAYTAHPASPEELVGVAATLLGSAGADRLGYFDQFPAPVYATDASGALIYFNPASVEFSGRTPVLGDDRWCISWKLQADDGTPLPHDQCPMAVAVREGRPVRGVEAYAERPDGDRIRFRPFPTPAINPAGEVVGAVNLLVPVDGVTGRKLRATANKCRDLARWVTDDRASKTLADMATECEGHAAVLLS